MVSCWNMNFTFFGLVIVLMTISNGVTGVLNGIPARIGQFKYLVAITYEYRQWCGGAIIGANYILSAAHCFGQPNLLEYRILAGIVNKHAPNPIERKIGMLYTHPQYIPAPCVEVNCFGMLVNRTYPAYDVAVVKLDLPLDLISFSHALDVVASPTRHISRCEVCHFAGWGSTRRHTYQPSNILMWTTFIPVTFATDGSAIVLPHLTDFEVIDPFGHSTTAHGDSGGPLVCGGKLVGILTGGASRLYAPAIFQNVYLFRDFIQAMITLIP